MQNKFVFLILASIFIFQGCGEQQNKVSFNDNKIPAQQLNFESKNKIEGNQNLSTEDAKAKQQLNIQNKHQSDIERKNEIAGEKTLPVLETSKVEQVSLYDREYHSYIRIKDTNLIRDLFEAYNKSKTQYDPSVKINSENKIIKDNAVQITPEHIVKIKMKNGQSLLIMDANNFQVVRKIPTQLEGTMITKGPIGDFFNKNSSRLQEIKNESVLVKDYNKVIGLTLDNVTKMYVGYRAPSGWEYNTTNKTQIKAVINYLENQQYTKEVNPQKPYLTGTPNLYIVIFYVNGKAEPVTQVSFNAADGRKVTINDEFYLISENSPEYAKKFFEELKEIN